MKLIPVHLFNLITLALDSWVEVAVQIAGERPDVDSIVLGRRDDHAVVQRVEHRANERVSVTDEGLEVVWNGLLRLVIPHLKQVVLSTSQHVATIGGEVCAGDCTLVNSGKLADVLALESRKAVDPNALILGHDDDLTVRFGELEAADDAAYIDLVLENDAI